jgi:hypothetical protein
VRLLAGYILFLALTAAAAAQAQTSAWWYPLGPPGATRYQPMKAPAADTPVVRWRSSLLRGSDVVLVGALRNGANRDSTNAQQIIGQLGNEIRILRSEGWLDTAVAQFFLPSGSAVRLTGLFNTLASSPLPAGQPNTVGLGVTREQSGDPTRRLYGLLLDASLSPAQQLAIGRTENATPPNDIASIYPVAAYRPPSVGGPIAVALVSQESYAGGDGADTMINGVRRYALSETATQVDPSWSLKFAPMAYAQAPALAVDTSEGGLLVAPSLGSYTFRPRVRLDQPIPGRGTRTTYSDEAYGILTHAEQSSLIDPIEVVPVPAIPVPGEAHSYFVELARRSSEPSLKYRLVAENHDAARPGTARLYLRRYDVGITGQLGLVEDPQMQNVGWSIVQADLDANDPSRQFPSGMVLNRGLEIVGARRNLDGSASGANTLYLIRYNEGALIDGNPFGVFARQRFNGDLLVAGDLVSDPDGKDEIVVADGPRVSILRFRRYSDPRMSAEQPEYFDTVASYMLDATVASAAIADVEGDGANDLIVVTAGSTYVIGRPHPAPLGVLRASRAALCSGDTLSFAWRRAVGGGEDGLRAQIVRVDSGEVVVDSLVVPSSPERFTHNLGALAPGRYRLRLSDVDVPAVSAESDEFAIEAITIEPFSVPGAVAGDVVTIATRARCADSLTLEFSTGSSWQRVGSGPVAVVDDTASFTIPMPCPLESNCDEATSEKAVRFRFTTTDGRIISPVSSTLVRVAQRTVEAPEPTAGSTRRRTLVWSPSEFLCDSVRIRLSTDDGASWSDAGSAPAAEGRVDVDVPGEIQQQVQARVCCEEGCGTGLATFRVAEIGEANFIAPNPYDPSDAADAAAAIVYRLTQSGTVTIAIYDVARTPVRTIVAAEPLGSGLHRATWDGRNAAGEIVADGTYICVIASSSGEKLALPLSVAKR